MVDIATGSGLVAIAAAMAGAASVTATDIDPFARAAVALNARANAVTVIASAVDILAGDVLAGDIPAGDGAGRPGDGAAAADVATSDVALVGDAFYEKELAARVLRFVERAHTRGAAVLVGDLGRTYLPRSGFAELVAYAVPVLPALEGADVKRTAVWQPAW